MSDQGPTKKREEVSRPITLYISRIGLDTPTLDHIHKERVTALDVEMSEEDAKVLKVHLESLLSQKSGALRIRLFGRLVLS